MKNMDTFYQLMKFQSEKHPKCTDNFDQLLLDISKKKSGGDLGKQNIKNLLIIYASGSAGANSNLQISRQSLKSYLIKNFYFCDNEIKQDPTYNKIISRKFDNSTRIRYQIHELDSIQSSVKLSISLAVQIASIVQKNYHDFDSFLIIFGMDTICYFASALSFMLQNLNKLVICTGGNLPLSKMRNQSVMNLIQSFAIVAQVPSLNDVLIVNKNKGYRANRCIKQSQGDFQSILSPNLAPIVSIKTKLTMRSFLLEPRPTAKFSVFYNLSPAVKFLQLNFFQSLQSIEYQLNNPYIKGIVIESYSFANLPNNEKLLNLFKKAYEEREIIFVNISQTIKSQNQSVMAEYLKTFHIHYGSDMMPHAALAKLSYLIGKNLPKQQIIKLISKNLRGELTEAKDRLQFELAHTPIMQIFQDVIRHQYPTNIKEDLIVQIQRKVIKYIVETCTPQEFKKIFGQQIFKPSFQKQDNDEQLGDGVKNTEIQKFIKTHSLMHLLAKKRNMKMLVQMITYVKDINQLDNHQCSPMFYALQNLDKQMIHLMKHHGGKVRAPISKLFTLFITHLKKDNKNFFQLLFHTEFRTTLKSIENAEKRKVTHLAALLKAHECYNFLKQKLVVPCDSQDIYQKTAHDYTKSINILLHNKKSKSDF